MVEGLGASIVIARYGDNTLARRGDQWHFAGRLAEAGALTSHSAPPFRLRIELRRVEKGSQKAVGRLVKFSLEDF